MPGLIKVGKTTTHPSQRMSELHSTGVPTPFELEFCAIVSNCTYSEKVAHRALASYRVAGNREFFRVQIKTAIELIIPQIGEYDIHYARDTHGIEQLCRKIASAEQKKENAKRDRQNRLADEVERVAELRAARRGAIEQNILAAEKKLEALGPRPVEKQFPLIVYILSICYFPIPLGWMFWGAAINNLSRAETRETGVGFILFILAGYIATALIKKHEQGFKTAIVPFWEIDKELSCLRKELEKHP